MATEIRSQIPKLTTGIPGLDLLSRGGLPRNRTTLVTGTAGTGKTILAAQFLARGIGEHDEPGVFVTFEDAPVDLRANMAGFGWPIERWEKENKWMFVDASPSFDEQTFVAGPYDLDALLHRIRGAIGKVGAVRVAMDSIGALSLQFTEASQVRFELAHIASELRTMKVTSVLTAERTEEFGPVARHGVEDFISDNVIILRNVLERERRRRTIELLKLRGTDHDKGEYPFTIVADDGMVVLPQSSAETIQPASTERIGSGSNELDEMCGGGFFRDSVVLVSGATGTGKTLTSTHFVAEGVNAGERCLLLAFEESREQLLRNAAGWGIDFAGMEAKGLLRIERRHPGSAGLEDHLNAMQQLVREFEPQRVVIDSLSALEHMSSQRTFREFAMGFSGFLKQRGVAGFFTSTTPNLFGGTSITEAHISTISDTILLLRYVEVLGEMRRGIAVLKMRGSMHEKSIREFTVDASGMHIGLPFRSVSGILGGQAMPSPGEVQRLEELFEDEAS